MNTVHPDPAPITTIGAIQHIALCMRIANAAALRTIRMGWPVGDTDGQWWIDISPLLDAQTLGAEQATEAQQHIAVALYASLIQRHPRHAGWVRIISTTGAPT